MKHKKRRIQTKRWKYLLTREDRVDVFKKQEKKKVLKFSVNYSILVKGKWKSIVRYDSSHEQYRYPHRHTFYKSGKRFVIRHRTDDYNQVFTHANKDISKNYQKYRDNYFLK